MHEKKKRYTEQRKRRVAEDAASHLHAGPQSVSSLLLEPGRGVAGPDQGHLMQLLARSVWSRHTKKKKKKQTHPWLFWSL